MFTYVYRVESVRLYDSVEGILGQNHFEVGSVTSALCPGCPSTLTHCHGLGLSRGRPSGRVEMFVGHCRLL